MSLNAACSNTKMILSENAGEVKLIAAEKKESYSNAAINKKSRQELAHAKYCIL